MKENYGMKIELRQSCKWGWPDYCKNQHLKAIVLAGLNTSVALIGTKATNSSTKQTQAFL